MPVELRGQDVGDEADEIQTYRIASEDGSSVVFTSVEQLTADDVNTAPDVYLWHEGQVSLVTGVTGARGVTASKETPGGFGPSISPDGNSIFFGTRATILPQDTNNGGYDFYVARVGGGFPQEATVPAGCHSEDECRPPTPGGGGAGSPSPPATEVVRSGNPQQQRPCPPGKVLRKGHCKKKTKGKAKRHHREHRDRAGADRGTGR